MKRIIPITIGGATLGQMLSLAIGVLLFADGSAVWYELVAGTPTLCLSLLFAWAVPVATFALAWRYAAYPEWERAIFFMALLLPLALGAMGGVMGAFMVRIHTPLLLALLYLVVAVLLAPTFSAALTYVLVRGE